MRTLKNIFRGMGSIMNIFPEPPRPTKPPQPLSTEEAFKRDSEALAGDWKRVGEDMKKGIEEVVKEINDE